MEQQEKLQLQKVNNYLSLLLMRKGDIFWAANKGANPHPIVFLKWIDKKKFRACILSTKPTNGNILMSEEHFFESDENGRQYSIQYSPTYLVPNDTFIKFTFWLSSEVAQGRLTEQGIDFVESLATGEPILFPAPIWKYKQKNR